MGWQLKKEKLMDCVCVGHHLEQENPNVQELELKTETTKRLIIDDWPAVDDGGKVLPQHLRIWGDRYLFTAE